MKHIARIVGEDNLAKAFEDLYKVVVNYIEYSREYDKRLGSEARRKRTDWEKRLYQLVDEIENNKYT